MASKGGRERCLVSATRDILGGFPKRTSIGRSIGVVPLS